LSRDASGRSFPESGITTGFPQRVATTASREDRIMEFAKITGTTSSLLPVPPGEAEGDAPTATANLLDNSLILYGSPMADSNIHKP